MKEEKVIMLEILNFSVDGKAVLFIAYRLKKYE